MKDEFLNSEYLNSEYRELLAGYVLGDLDSEELAQLQELLRQNPALKMEILSLQETLGAIPLGAELQRPPANLKSRILQNAEPSVRQENNDQVQRGEKLQSRLRIRWAWGPIVTGVAVAGAIALGWQNMQLRQQLAVTEAENQSYKIVIASDEMPSQDTWQSFKEVVSDHSNSLTRSQGPVDFATQDLAAVRSQYSQRIALSGKFPELRKAKLLGGSLCALSKTEGLRLSYKTASGEVISFYQLHRQGFSLDINQTPIPIQVFDGPNGLVWGDQNYVFVLVGDAPATMIRQLQRSLEST
ncbi:MAG: hypothetical protein AAF889_08720 [Cyanobacteria bacterium P01_D01_bin.73]